MRSTRTAALTLILACAVVISVSACTSPAEPSLAGKTYTSVSGHGTGGDLAWLASQPLVMKLEVMDDQQTLVMDTPCNTLNADVQVTSTQITLTEPQRIAVTAMGCLGPEGGYEAWATEFIETPITYRNTDGFLTLTSPAGEVVFTAN